MVPGTVKPPMSERSRNLVTIAALAVMAIALVVLVASNPTNVDRVEAIGERIKCPVCQGESIGNSPAPMARDMMALVSERVDEGRNDDAIVDELLASFSGAVLLDPPVSGATLLLWVAPIAALIVGGIVIVWWRKHPQELPPETGPPRETTRARRLTPILIMGGVFALVVVVAGFFLQDRDGPASGVADLGSRNLEDVSNETMEAVIAANADIPQIDGMRLALAERYYEEGDYSAAFPHFLEVAQSPTATDSQAAGALIRLGWMAWEGNAEVETAVELFDQALAIDRASSTARYLKGQVLWCGAGDVDAATQLFEDVLADSQLNTEDRHRVEADLDAIDNGASCT